MFQMSRQNVEVVRKAYEAWNAGDLDAAAEFRDPVVEWPVTPNFPGGRHL
jgi:ketosteroid isomerase-like protein